MDRFKRLILEVHRRSLWQVLSIYLVASWVGYEVISELTQGLGLPDWVPGLAVVLFLIGLPIVLATAFIQEGGPNRRDQPAASYAPADPTLLPLDLEPARADAPVRHQLFTWKKAIAGGIAAFLLLGVTAAGYMGMRNAGIGPFGSLLAKGALDNRERVLIAEFSDVAGDSVLAQAVTQAFRVSFAQSDVITVLEPAYVRTVLGRMQRPATSRLDAELAREVAQRDNIKAYVTGEIARVGGRYSVIGKLLSSVDATVLASYAQEAADSTEILAAVDKLSRKLREKIGESLRTIRNDQPLAAVTTPSLEALRKYTQAERALDAGDATRSVALLQEAVALDSAFAMAWRKLGVVYGNTDAPFAKILEAQTSAYRHRDRLTEFERYLTAGSYHSSITEDLGQAEQAYRNALDVQPDNPTALINLGTVYMRKRDFQRASEVTERALRVNPKNYIPYGNLIEVLVSLGQVDSATAVGEALRGVLGAVAPYYYYQTGLFAAKRDYGAAEQSARETIRLAGGEFARPLNMRHASALAVLGRLADGERVLSELERIERAQGDKHAGLHHALAVAQADILIRQDPEGGYRRIVAALEREPLDDVAVENRPYLGLAGVLAASGHAERARPLLAEYAKLPRELRGDDRDDVAETEGWIALAEERWADAIAHFRTATTLGACPRCEHVELGVAFEGAAQPDSAIVHYEYWLATPYGEDQVEHEAPRLATVYERLAELYERKGNPQKAALYAGRLVELWQHADAELQPRVRAKQALLQRLGADRTP